LRSKILPQAQFICAEEVKGTGSPASWLAGETMTPIEAMNLLYELKQKL